MKVLVVHQQVPPDAARDVVDVLEQARAVAGALRSRGHQVVEYAASLDLRGLDACLGEDVEVVFNLVEELAGSGRLAALIPALVSARGLPCTGAGAAELSLADDKVRAKLRLLAAGLPTPSFLARGGLSSPEPPRGKVILKARFEHGSLGLEAQSVCALPPEQELDSLLTAVEQGIGSEAFAEAYIDGREFNVTLLPQRGRLTPLQPVEILFEHLPADAPRVVGYRAKWDEQSLEYGSTPRRHQFPEQQTALLQRLTRVAVEACSALGVSSFCRVDFRVDLSGAIFVLEVNANPCLSLGAGFDAAVSAAGIGYDAAIDAIVLAALEPNPREEAGQGAELIRQGAAGGRELGSSRPAGCTGGGALWLSGQRSGPTSEPFRSEPRVSDLEAVAALVRGTGHFSGEEVAIAVELVQARLDQGSTSGYHFALLDEGDELLGYACWGPTPGSEQSCDLYWIAVDSRHQGRGLGRRLLDEVARQVALHVPQGARLYAETSGSPLYSATRGFYLRCGFELVATLPDFYRPGDDKLIFLAILA